MSETVGAGLVICDMRLAALSFSLGGVSLLSRSGGKGCPSLISVKEIGWRTTNFGGGSLCGRIGGLELPGLVACFGLLGEGRVGMRVWA